MSGVTALLVILCADRFYMTKEAIQKIIPFSAQKLRLEDRFKLAKANG